MQIVLNKRILAAAAVLLSVVMTFSMASRAEAQFGGTATHRSQISSPLSNTSLNMDQLRALVEALNSHVNRMQYQAPMLLPVPRTASPSTSTTGSTAGRESAAPASSGALAGSCPAFTFSLSQDMSDQGTNGEVSRLQQFLARDPSIYPEGLVTGFFGPATERAVQRFQARYGIVSSGTPDTTGYGAVGPRTRNAIAQVCAGSSMDQGSLTSAGAAAGGQLTLSVSSDNPLAVTARFASGTCELYELDWGDGTKEDRSRGSSWPAINESSPCMDDLQPISLTHTYRQAGTYTVTFTPKGERVTSAGRTPQTRQITVSGPSEPQLGKVADSIPTSSFPLTIVPGSGNAPLTVTAKFVADICTGAYIAWGDGHTTNLWRAQNDSEFQELCSYRASVSAATRIQRWREVTREYTYNFGGTHSGWIITGGLTREFKVTVSGGLSIPDPRGASDGTISYTSDYPPVTTSISFAAGPCDSYSINWGDGRDYESVQPAIRVSQWPIPDSGECARSQVSRSHTYDRAGSFNISVNRNGTQILADSVRVLRR